MDDKLIIKEEEDPRNERENDEMAIATETSFTDFGSQSEFVTCGEVDIKTETEVQTLVSVVRSQKETEFLSENPLMKLEKYNSDYETVNKIEIKEEAWWLETETSSVCDDMKDDERFTAVISPSNNCEMDDKLIIKEEEDPRNERENDEMAIATETSFTDFGSQSEFVTCGEVDIKTETEVQTLVSVVRSQKETEFLSENPLMKLEKYNSDYETVNKIEIKEEAWWLETETSSVCDDMKDDERFTAVISPRWCSAAVSGDSNGELPLPSAEISKKIACFCNKINCAESGGQESITPAAKSVHSKQYGECNDRGEICSLTLYSKQKSLIHKDQPQKNSICESSSTNKSKLKRYEVIDGSIKPHKCEICEKRFTQLSYLKVHCFIHEDEKPHKCEICEKGFATVSHLKVHKIFHEGKRPYKCEICGKRYTQLSNLKVHNLIHEGKKLHKCEICEKGFATVSHLKVHKLFHEGKRPYKCEICGKRYTQLSNLKVHNLIHEGKKLHKCEICEKGFATVSRLKVHKLFHEGKRPYKCEICGKRYTQLSNLKVHNLIHEGKKLHKCEICEKGFATVSYLKAHKLFHEGKRPYKCEICGKRYTQLSNLKVHNLIHEGKKLHKCEICEKRYTRSSDLKVHYLNHEGKKPHKCEICEKRFTKLSTLKTHKFVHEDKKPHRCEICDKSYAQLSQLKVHNLTHEGKKPHKCEICHKRFTKLSNLKRHNLIHQRHNAIQEIYS